MASRAERFDRVVLETSLKPFQDFSEESIARTAAEIATAWAPLLAQGTRAAVLLWIADGSELLDWAGREDDPVEWGRWVGFNNTEADPYGHNVTPEKRAVPYRTPTPELDYAGIRRVVEGLRRTVSTMTGMPVEIGATMDSGPEFARSSFKYERHPEILADVAASGVGRVIKMVRPWNDLAGDDRRYAAYPNGIPGGTPFGEFLGRQARDYLAAMGFDYLWLSNGFGFSAYSWTALGEVFDGEVFATERAPDVRARILAFWDVFEKAVGFPIEVRGTNFGIGMDIGTDAVPAREIYRSPVVRNPPPNSPWGPLNRDFGIELSGYLSRIARLPDRGYPFRFYAADPWFWQTPWRDFYGGEPFDIHLPLSLSRVTGDGAIQVPSDIEILTVDDQRGRLDPAAASEIATFVARSRAVAPDAPAPLVWMYPFDAYHDILEREPETIGHPFFEDWLISAGMSTGVPIASVLDMAEALGALRSGALDVSTLVTPVSGLDATGVLVVDEALERGVDVVLYGSLAHRPEIARRLGIETDADGDDGDLPLDGVLGVGTLRHVGVLSGGPLTERLSDGATDVEVLATVAGRPYALQRQRGPAKLRWFRGSSDFDGAPEDEHGLRTPRRVDRARVSSPAALFAELLAGTGWRASATDPRPDAADPVVTYSRHAGALVVTAYLADTTVGLSLRTPWGAPVLTGLEACVDGDTAEYRVGTTTFREARVMVRQPVPGVVAVDELAPFPYGVERLIAVTGLRDAEVVLLMPTGARALPVLADGVEIHPASAGGEVRLSGVSGELRFGWMRNEGSAP